MPLRAVVFDFDGVIANSEPLHLRAFQEVLAGAGVPLSDAEYYARYLGFDDAGVFRTMRDDRAMDWTPADIDRFVALKASRMEILERHVSLLFPGAADAIRRLAAAVPLAIASGALGVEIRRALDREQLTPFFAAIVAAEDTSAGKPSAEPYLRAVEELGVAKGDRFRAGDCVAVEDSVWGLESARAAGLRTVAVTHTYPAAVLQAADLIVESLHDLTFDVLDRLRSR